MTRPDRVPANVQAGGKGATEYTTVFDDGTVVERDAEVGAKTARRQATDDDIVLVSVDIRSGRGAAIPAGARLAPGTTAD
ncbi:MAG TPA: hypothetical protein VES01_03390 [Dermatophilaceae bacterium]|nr:hypothetical protein [Dermatophilaceae bacterium]